MSNEDRDRQPGSHGSGPLRAFRGRFRKPVRRPEREPENLTRKQIRLSRRQAQQRRYVIIGAIITAVLVIGLIAVGALYENVLKPRQSVATVLGEDITVGDFQKRVQFQRFQLRQQLQQYQQLQSQFTDPNNPQSSGIFDQQIQQLQSQLSDPTTLGQQVLNQMADEVIIRKEAQARGITVSDAEVTEELEHQFNYYPISPTPTATSTPTITPTMTITPTATRTPAPTLTPKFTPTATAPAVGPLPPPTATLTPTLTPTRGPSPTPSPTGTPPPTPTPLTEQGFKDSLQQFLSSVGPSTGFTQADIRKLIENQLYRQKLEKVIGDEVPKQQEQVKLDVLHFEADKVAQDALAKLKSGQKFEALFGQVQSGDVVSATATSDDWALQTAVEQQYGNLMVTQAFSMPVGTVSTQVITTTTQPGTFFLAKTVAREVRVVPDSMLQQLQTQHFSDWLTQQHTKDVNIHDDVWLQNMPKDYLQSSSSSQNPSP